VKKDQEIVPYMTDEEIQAFKQVLDSLSQKGSVRVFEYGSGGSTVYFSNYLKNSGCDFVWFSLEHDVKWGTQVDGWLRSNQLHNVHLLLTEVPGHKPAKLNKAILRKKMVEQGTTFDYSRYTPVVKNMGMKFDLVLVDARDRKNCLNYAWESLNPGGYALFHDASRDYYQCVFEKYPQGKFVCENLWVAQK